jgi:hypothetical protein
MPDEDKRNHNAQAKGQELITNGWFYGGGGGSWTFRLIDAIQVIDFISARGALFAPSAGSDVRNLYGGNSVRGGGKRTASTIFAIAVVRRLYEKTT